MKNGVTFEGHNIPVNLQRSIKQTETKNQIEKIETHQLTW